ncbi:hypothetical protein [Pontibacter burrus]|uniref:Uncharacterized protein n=1 Tax=Pontibacter burrus TaxID=2704466 RepID=A0A6B3LT62_9BACT|nr:hypothetical protein [Pontibacter burrus]NEM97198.1 hypothetical protein [Pontibacter burrus]
MPFSCNRHLQLQETVVPLDSLHITPEAETELAKYKIKLTSIKDTHVLLTQPSPKKGKTKYKNIGNTDIKQKDVGNVDVGKKAGQQHDVGNTVIKDVGKVEPTSQSYWWLWLIGALIIIIYKAIKYLRI